MRFWARGEVRASLNGLPEQSVAWRRVFSFPVLLGSALAVEGFALSGDFGAPAGRVFRSGDIWWLIASGKAILSTGKWPATDIYSFTVQGNTWINYQWLFGVVMAIVERLGGLQALAALFSVLWCAFLLLVYSCASIRSGNAKAAAVATALVPLILQAPTLLSLRSQLLGYIFLTLTLIGLERFKQGRPRSLWMLPGVFLLWVNVHGNFVLGLLALGIYVAGGLTEFSCGPVVAQRWTSTQLRRLLVISFLSILSLTVTPYGARLAAYPLEFTVLQGNVIRHMTEWAPLRVTSPLGMGFLGLLATFVLAAARTRMAFRLEEVVLLAIAAGESLFHIRFLFLFAVVFTPMFAAVLARWVPRYEPKLDRPVLNVALMVLFASGIFASFPSQARLNQALSRIYPREALEFLRKDPAARQIYSDDSWGSYLLYSLGPNRKVFIDGRFDIYDYAGVFSDFIRIDTAGPQTASLIHKYGIDTFLIFRGSRLADYLASRGDWKQGYADDMSVVFMRDSDRVSKVTGGLTPAGGKQPSGEVR